MILTGQTKEMVVRCEGDRVLLIYNGTLVCSLPYQAAEQLSRAILAKAKQAEEQAHALDIVSDQAILTRLGIPFGLSNRRDILKEAANEAAWNSKLRRYIPPARAGGIASQAIFGTPAVIRHDPKGKDNEQL